MTNTITYLTAIKQLDQNLIELNSEFSDKSSVSKRIEKIQNLIKTLPDKIFQLQSNQRKKSLCGRFKKFASTQQGITQIAKVTFWISAVVLNSISVKFTDNLPTVFIVATIAAIFFNGVFDFLGKRIEREKNLDKEKKEEIKDQLFFQILHKNYTQTENLNKKLNIAIDKLKNLEKFFSTFKKFEETLKKQKDDQQQVLKQQVKIKKCIKELKNIDPLYRREIPSDSNWISLMLSMLTKKHTLRSLFDKLFTKTNQSTTAKVPSKFKSEKESLIESDQLISRLQNQNKKWNELEDALETEIPYLVKNGICLDRYGRAWNQKSPDTNDTNTLKEVISL
jgi:hypothetical protein